jgi:hypothetical protein
MGLMFDFILSEFCGHLKLSLLSVWASEIPEWNEAQTQHLTVPRQAPHPVNFIAWTPNRARD